MTTVEITAVKSGKRYVHLAVHVDDLFLASALWDPAPQEPWVADNPISSVA